MKKKIEEFYVECSSLTDEELSELRQKLLDEEVYEFIQVIDDTLQVRYELKNKQYTIMKTRIYLMASESCPACDNAKASLGIENTGKNANKLEVTDDVTLHVVYPKNNPGMFNRLQVRRTPSYAFMTVEDVNGDGIYEGAEETLVKTYDGFIGLNGLKEIVEQIKEGKVLATEL